MFVGSVLIGAMALAAPWTKGPAAKIVATAKAASKARVATARPSASAQHRRASGQEMER